MTIFEAKVRTDTRWKNHIESDFDYLDRCGRPEAARVREFMEEWYARFPADHQADLRARIRSCDDHSFQSAGFELVLFACMSGLGYTVDVHPVLPSGSAKRPDFLVRGDEDVAFYLEAVLASDFNKAEVAARKRFNTVLESLEGIDSPNFFLGIMSDDTPERPPPTKKLKRDLQAWLASLDPDDAARALGPGGSQKLPEFHWDHEGWRIRFEAIPKSPEARGKGQRVIGLQMGGADWVNIWEPIRDAIKEKGRKYGELDRPMLIAVSVSSPSMDEIDELQALYGQEQVVVNFLDPSAKPRLKYTPNGAWHGPKGAQYTRISGAWIFRSMDPWHVGMADPTLYFNPHASQPLPKNMEAVSHSKIVEGYPTRFKGKTPREILGLPEGWPE